MSSYKFMDAMENMFDPEATVTTLLDAVRENVRSTVKTVDQACSLENKLSEEAAQFNNCLMTMSNAIRKCERGEISREEMLSDCAPCVDALKNKCVALTLANVKTVGDDITEDEIAMLREYIVGCKDIVADRKIELQDCSMASESYGIATEASAASVGKAIRKSTDAKTAAECYKQAKKLYGFGSKEEAKKYLAKAKKLYEKCLATAKKHGNMQTVERKSTAKVSSGKNNYNSEDTYKKSVSMNGMGTIISYFEDRIDACTALQMQWDNKAGKSTFAETKAQLKAERKASKKAYQFNKFKKKQAMKAVNAARGSAAGSLYKYKKMMKSAAESWEEYEMIDSNFEFMESMESFVDDVLLDCELITAMESEGDPEGGKSEAEQKLEDLYIEFKKAKDEGNGPEMDRLSKEIQKVIDIIGKEAEDAVTEEDFAAAKRKQKKAIAIGAGVVATAAAIAAGVKTGAFKAVAEKARTTVNNMKEKKNDKAATAEGKSILGTIKTALGSIPGKFRGAFKKKKGGEAEAADESFIDDMSIEEFESSMEAFMDSVEMDLAMEAAMESEGDESAEGASKASGIGSRLRAKFAKLKRAKKSGSEAEVKEAADEVSEVIDEYAEAVDEAETPEEKKKLGKAAKIGIAAAGTALVAAGVYVGGKKAASYADKLDAERASGADLNKAKSLLISAVNTVRNAKKSVKDKATEIGGRFAAKKLNEKYNGNGKDKKKFKLFGKKKANESFLSDLAFGLEGVMVDDEDIDDDEIDNLEGRAFDDDDMIDEATESAIAVMMAEDGIDDSDLDFMF